MGASTTLLGVTGRRSICVLGMANTVDAGRRHRDRAETTLGPKPNGAARAARLNTDAPSTPIEALDSGIYAVPGGGYRSSSPGLYMLPWSGAGERQVTGRFWHAIGGGAAWGTVSQSVPQGAANAILRLDLGGGSPA